MISFIRGTVHAVTGTSVILDVSGVGMELLVTGRCRSALRAGQVATVPASLVVREDNWTLYGFADSDERACFQTLQLARGVGPKVAISLLSALSPDQLRRAVAAGDAKALTAAPGIGSKGAERLVIDLRDRLGPVSGGVASAGDPSPHLSGWRRDVQLALVGLGWTPADAVAALARIEDSAKPGGEGCHSSGTPDSAKLLRLALQTLDRTAGPR